MIPVVSALAMRELEQSCGMAPATLMDKAAEGIARFIEAFVQDQDLPRQVLMMVGKGNNGGDAYTAGLLLLKQGFSVLAYSPFPLSDLSPLCKERHDRFVTRKGKVVFTLPPDVSTYSLVIDGLVGTGFQGKAEGALAQAIEWANALKLPIFSIDIPSGLDATSGTVATVAIHAFATLSISFPKIGFFLEQGWDHVGQIIPIDLGLPLSHHPTAELFTPTSLKLPPLKPSRYKYSAGYVLGIAGSPTMSGAAALAATAVLRSGAGILRLFTLPGTPAHHFIPEVIHEEYHLTRFQEELKRAAAVFVGPGLGRTSEVEKLLYQVLPSLSLPVVIDADALYFLAKNPSWKLPPEALLTPHRKEMETLLKQPPTLQTCQHFVEEHQATLILKGAPTILFHPGKKPLIIAAGDPGMATAGSGDILTGILAALLAQKIPLVEAATLGVYLHAKAGELAANELTSYSMIASDITSHLPEAFKEL